MEIHEAVPERDRKLIRALGTAAWAMTGLLVGAVVVLILAAVGVIGDPNGPLPKTPERTGESDGFPWVAMIAFFGLVATLAVLHQLAATQKTRLGRWLAGKDVV